MSSTEHARLAADNGSPTRGEDQSPSPEHSGTRDDQEQSDLPPTNNEEGRTSLDQNDPAPTNNGDGQTSNEHDTGVPPAREAEPPTAQQFSSLMQAVQALIRSREEPSERKKGEEHEFGKEERKRDRSSQRKRLRGSPRRRSTSRSSESSGRRPRKSSKRSKSKRSPSYSSESPGRKPRKSRKLSRSRRSGGKHHRARHSSPSSSEEERYHRSRGRDRRRERSGDYRDNSAEHSRRSKYRRRHSDSDRSHSTKSIRSKRHRQRSVTESDSSTGRVTAKRSKHSRRRSPSYNGSGTEHPVPKSLRDPSHRSNPSCERAQSLTQSDMSLASTSCSPHRRGTDSNRTMDPPGLGSTTKSKANITEAANPALLPCDPHSQTIAGPSSTEHERARETTPVSTLTPVAQEFLSLVSPPLAQSKRPPSDLPSSPVGTSSNADQDQVEEEGDPEELWSQGFDAMTKEILSRTQSIYPKLIVQRDTPAQAEADEGEWVHLNAAGKPAPTLSFKRSGLVEGRLRQEHERLLQDRASLSQPPNLAKRTPLKPRGDRFAKFQEDDGRPSSVADNNLLQAFLPKPLARKAPPKPDNNEKALRLLEETARRSVNALNHLDAIKNIVVASSLEPARDGKLGKVWKEGADPNFLMLLMQSQHQAIEQLSTLTGHLLASAVLDRRQAALSPSSLPWDIARPLYEADHKEKGLFNTEAMGKAKKDFESEAVTRSLQRSAGFKPQGKVFSPQGKLRQATKKKPQAPRTLTSSPAASSSSGQQGVVQPQAFGAPSTFTKGNFHRAKPQIKRK